MQAGSIDYGPRNCNCVYMYTQLHGYSCRHRSEPRWRLYDGKPGQQQCPLLKTCPCASPARVPVVGFYPCCRWAVSTSTPLGVHQPTASAVLPAVHDRTEGVPDRWRSCLERPSIWRYVCSVAGRLWTALENRSFSPLLQCCLTVPYSYSGPWNGLSI